VSACNLRPELHGRAARAREASLLVLGFSSPTTGHAVFLTAQLLFGFDGHLIE
jgi:hypothetical protein